MRKEVGTIMVKKLRSLIHERLPLELRVQIELLSRRRDLINEEKHQELIQLLQKFNIQGVVPLGPGTNRYAFKLNGFVIKVATDHDGKIDNLKEFKMAKRLYPRVTQIYEVSDNGTLLVAEYIQPFASYQEMCKYAERIREILSELSSVYLIGDVGITSKNYANWGLRIGSDDPVCLDFAYVYEVSSELFICRNCKSNSMLVPNSDFTELCCPNKGCGKRYQFEDIRSRIGNDIHRHEIGDLSDEGYALVESNKEIELDEKRSNYLARKKDKTKESKEELKQEPVYEPFVMEHSPRFYINNKEETEMSINDGKKEFTGFRFSNGMVIPAVATVMSQDEEVEMVQAHIAYDEPCDNEQDNEAVEMVEPMETDDTEIAFTGTIETRLATSDEYLKSPIPEAVVIQNPMSSLEKSVTTAIPLVSPTVVSKESMGTVENETPAPEPYIPIEVKSVREVKPEKPVQQKHKFSDNFMRNAEWAVSKLANTIGNHMHALLLFDTVRGNIRDRKMYPETFYKAVGSAVFRSIITFCDFTEIPASESTQFDKDGNPRRVFKIPDAIEGMCYEPTLIFVSRFWVNRDINSMEDPGEIMMKYRERFEDYQGIQREWLEVFRKRLLDKIQIDASGADKIVNIVADLWCVIEDEDDGIEEIEEVKAPEEEPEILESPVEEYVEEGPLDISGTYTMDDQMDSPQVDVAQNPSEEYNEAGDDGEDDYYSESEYLSVEISLDEEFDVIKIISGDAYGPTNIPFYVKLDDIIVDPTTAVPSIVDDRNGVWDWLIHMVPDMMFRTKNPDKWLEVNKYNDLEEQLHIVILDESDGEYLMGIYYVSGIYIMDNDNNAHPIINEDILAKLNKLITDNIGYGAISHLRRSISATELIKPEEYISDLVVYEDVETEEEEPMNENANTMAMSEAEAAAVRYVMNNGTGEIVDPEQQKLNYTPPTETAVEETHVNEDVEEVEEFADTPKQQEEEVNTQPTGILTPVRRKRN